MQEIESQDKLKVYASVWEVDDNGKIVYTKDGKVVLNTEPFQDNGEPTERTDFHDGTDGNLSIPCGSAQTST